MLFELVITEIALLFYFLLHSEQNVKENGWLPANLSSAVSVLHFRKKAEKRNFMRNFAMGLVGREMRFMPKKVDLLGKEQIGGRSCHSYGTYR